MSMRTWIRLMCVVAAFGLTFSLGACKKEEPAPKPTPPAEAPPEAPAEQPAETPAEPSAP